MSDTPTAGEAFKRLMDDDPAEAERIKKLLADSAELWRAVLVEIQASEADLRKEWADDFGIEYPTTIEQWETLAVRAGLDANVVYSGKWTPGELYSIIVGYLQRLADLNGNPSDKEGDTPEQEQQGSSVGPEVQRAAMLYKQATEADLSLKTDKQVWGAIEEAADVSEKRDEIAPSFSAFQRQLGRARKAGLLEPKRSPRHQGRATGKSVVRYDQL